MEALAQYRSLRKEGRLAEALVLARAHLRIQEPGAITPWAPLIRKDVDAAFPDGKPLRVLVVGQCTTSYLLPLLAAWSWVEGVHIAAAEGGYDQVMQDLMAVTEAPDVVVLLPWHQRLLAPDARTAADRIEDEMAFLQQCWQQVARLKSKLVQVGYDWAVPGALGYSLSARRDGDVALVRQANASLHASMPAGTFFVDLESLSAWHGKLGFYDERNYHWLKQPFTPLGLSVLARHIAAGLRTFTSGRRKVLVLDLDNTLWGGVVGELGAAGVAMGRTSAAGEAFLAFQHFAKRLKASGILLAACSKNNDADAREPFEKNPEFALKMEDFAAFHASWDPKPSRMREIARELNLGLDAFVFFDDNPAERAHMRAELPEVLVVEVPEEPAHYIRALQQALAFEAVDVTAADSERASQYTAEASRRQASERAASPEEYLASLGMKAAVEPVTEKNLDRVTDLVTKTNQFNLTTRRHSRAAIEAMSGASRAVCFALSLSDRFGDYGIVAVVLGVPSDETTLRVDTWLMSCRAMGRTVEHFTLNALVEAARAQGYGKIAAEYLPTAKNVPVKALLPDFGFVPAPEWGGFFHVLAVDGVAPQPTQVAPAS